MICALASTVRLMIIQAMHAERDIVMAFPSVGLSVRLSSAGILTRVNEWMYRQTLSRILIGASFWCFSSPTAVTNFQWEPFGGGIKYTGVGKFRLLSQKRYEIGL